MSSALELATNHMTYALIVRCAVLMLNRMTVPAADCQTPMTTTRPAKAETPSVAVKTPINMALALMIC